MQSNQPRSPPLALEPGSFDFSAASLAKAPGSFFSRAMMSLASASFSTRMWRALYSVPDTVALMRSYSAFSASSLTGLFLT